MSITTLAWVTARSARGTDEDEAPALAALARTGVRVEVVEWDDPEVDWATFDRVVVRSTWDYAERMPEFTAWLARVAAASDLVNTLPALMWSMDKQYLGELDAAGVPITPTAFVAPGDRPVFPAGRFVVKPAVGAGSRDAAWYGTDGHTAAMDHVRRLHDRRQVVLVQPLVPSVATDGEWPLVFFGGRYSHAASKRVVLSEARSIDELFAPETNAPHAATEEQIAVASAALDVVTRRFGAVRYARVDLVRAEDGTSQVLEIELLEPSLFLPYADPGAADRLAGALVS